MTSYRIIKAITNNMVRARDLNDHEVILVGKGIGFGTKANDIISSKRVESRFSLDDDNERERFNQLVQVTSPKVVELAHEIIVQIQSRVNKPLSEHIHIALTDHIAFLVRRCKMGLPIENPFDLQTATLYPKEYAIASEIVDVLSSRLKLKIPSGEAGFISLHIISALHNETMAQLQEENYLIAKLVSVLEKQLTREIDKDSLSYVRLLTHIRFCIERTRRNEMIQAPSEMIAHIRETYPRCYELAQMMLQSIQDELNCPVNEAEVFYMSLHLYRYMQIV